MFLVCPGESPLSIELKWILKVKKQKYKIKSYVTLVVIWKLVFKLYLNLAMPYPWRLL